jgi:hypothetical protein
MAPKFQPWITRIDPSHGQLKVGSVPLCGPGQQRLNSVPSFFHPFVTTLRG